MALKNGLGLNREDEDIPSYQGRGVSLSRNGVMKKCLACLGESKKTFKWA